MSERTKSTPIWDRPEPAPRPTPGPLSRERIVRAAMGIADAEGLVSVSLRKVGAALEAGPMRLYGYLSTKEELLELMVDAVYGEILSVGPIEGDWREALRGMAHRTRQATRQHPWFVDLLGGRPNLGPHALRYLETSLATLSTLANIDDALQAFRTVHAYVIGAIRSEATELRAELETGMDKAAWQTANGPYVLRQIATGQFPMLARIVQEATHPSPDAVFDAGLECVLDGIAARLARG
ncbi:TetR/AcrR family transcriptional regulator C-terminal domain-containing protein [Pendulispora rubella]|uniref:TetR/AcrR family transcriptional regulator C-terminal domain-containing protein n=1 Tax=Pendulispora rubella TaxID=2741070 RepID=A0ABZ2L7L5_9BACT